MTGAQSVGSAGPRAPSAPNTTGRPRRILYVQRPRGGGSNESLYELVRCLDRSRFEPVILIHEPDSDTARYEALGVRVIGAWGGVVRSDARAVAGMAGRITASHRPAPPRTSRSARWPSMGASLVWRIARRIRTEGIDLIHHNNNLRVNRMSILAGRLARVPQVCHTRMLKRYSWLTDARIAALVDAFIYISHAVAQDVERQLGVRRTRGRIIHDPVDLDAFIRAEAARDRVRGELGIQGDAPLIVNPGRIVRWKGQDVFLRGMEPVLRTHPNALALVVGEPNESPESQAYLEELQHLAHALGIASRVRFTGFRRDIPELLAASDVVVHSSSEPEPLGRVVLEAMAAARPLVATAAGGVLDLVADGDTGLLVPLADPTGMADAIERLLAAPDRARQMGRSARNHVRRHFAPGPYAESIQNIYLDILRPSPAHA